MRPRPLALLLVPLLAWLLAGAQDRVIPREEAAWSTRVVATDGPARIVDHQTRLRTGPVRLVERHGARSQDGPPAVQHDIWLIASAPRIIGRVDDSPTPDAGARALAFPYDATAPPA